MSSDCYIDFFDTEEDRGGYQNLIGTERFGNLEVLNYFGNQFIDILYKLQKENSVINKDWRTIIIKELMAFFYNNLNDQTLSSERFSELYGYVGPYNIDWGDCPDPGWPQDMLRDYEKKFWQVRID